MDTKTLKSLQQALADLKAEQQMVGNAIETIQALLGNARSSSGRGPKTATLHVATAKSASRRKPKWTAAMRKAARDRMKHYWDQRRKGGSKN